MMSSSNQAIKPILAHKKSFRFSTIINSSSDRKTQSISTMNINAFSIFLLFTQVNTVASLVPQGEDSTLYFKLNGDTLSCEMVRNDANTASLCAAGNPISGYVSTHCPATCSMVTDSDMRFPVLLERPFGSGVYEDVWKQCSWVKKNPDKTCHRCEREGVRGTCIQTCSNCPPTTQPTPGTGCRDSPLPFTYDPFTDNTQKLNCDIVKNSSVDFCDLGPDSFGAIINTHCPVACSVDDCIGQESNMYFEVLITGELKLKQCDPWVMANNGAHCENRCARSSVAETCPVSCAMCPLS